MKEKLLKQLVLTGQIKKDEEISDVDLLEILELNEHEEKIIDQRRWVTVFETISKIGDTYWKFCTERGSTESQEVEYEERAIQMLYSLEEVFLTNVLVKQFLSEREGQDDKVFASTVKAIEEVRNSVPQNEEESIGWLTKSIALAINSQAQTPEIKTTEDALEHLKCILLVLYALEIMKKY